MMNIDRGAIEKIRPDLVDDERAKAMIDDTNKYATYAAFASSPAGTALIKEMMKELTDRVETIANTYAGLTHLELLTLCTALAGRIQLVKELSRADSNYRVVQDALAELIKS